MKTELGRGGKKGRVNVREGGYRRTRSGARRSDRREGNTAAKE